MALEIGLKGEASLVVGEAQTAVEYGAGGVRVLATPVMIGLMEKAAYNAAEAEMTDGDTTVGSLVHVRHLAATPVGQRVVATAELIEVDGRRLVFRVQARDEHRLIGEGTHERGRVNLARFLARVEAGG